VASNKIVLKPGHKIGEACAEDDAYFLSKCFIAKHQLEQVVELDNNCSIILGRTGTGKTAVLHHLEHTPALRVSKLDPEALFFQYVSNSKTFDFFISLGANLDVIFSLLWKHILLVESIKLYFDSKSSFENALRVFDGREKNIKAYINEWNSKFWTDSEVSMQEIVSKIETNLSAKAGVSIDTIQLGAEGAEKINLDEKIQIRRNITTAVNTPLNSLLHKAIEDLNSLTMKKNISFYIVLDELDENWIVSEFKYRLIRALIESIRKFRKVRKLKVVVAMRNDLYERTISETSDAGFQSEKHDGLIVKLNWTKAEMFKLLENRIAELFKWKYTKSSVKFYDVFPATVRKKDTFQYILDRTLMRPRDLIEFINTILDKSSGTSIMGKTGASNVIPQKRISEAEETYSAGRKQALIEEWSSVHPQLNIYINLLNSLSENFDFENSTIDENIDGIALEMCSCEKSKFHDSVRLACESYITTQSPLNKNRLKQEVFSVLYKVGAISIKLTPKTGFKNSFESNNYITSSSISLSTKFKIRPIFWRAFGITPNIGR